MDDLISRSDAIGAVKEERFPIDSDYAEGFMAALDKVEWILKEWLPSAQPETHDKRTETHACDCISRQAAIDEIEERKNANGYRNVAVISELNRLEGYIMRLPSAQPEPCEDTISRRAAINAIENTDCELPPYAWNELTDAIMKVPSAQPERRPMLYRDRVMLAKNFEEWARENHVIDCPEAIIYYLDIIGLIQPKRRAEAQDEIVRCKECKHGSPNGKYGCRVYHYRRYETHDMKPDDFCSRAERRTDDCV